MNPDVDLVQRWVRWAASSTRFRNPIGDSTGKLAGRRQPDDVFFLAGNFGGRTSRRCTVPAGRPLFFPTFNYWMWANHGELARWGHAAGSATFNGVPQTVAEIGAAEPFVVRGVWLNPVTNTLWGGKAKMRCWGLWVLVPPPAPGAHELHISGTDGHNFHVGVDYALTVC